jgi:hypothetical protein
MLVKTEKKNEAKRLSRLKKGLTRNAKSYLDDLSSGILTPQQFLLRMRKDLKTFHYAAYLAGSGKKALSPEDRRAVEAIVKRQGGYLERFSKELGTRPVTKRDYNRAYMYSSALSESYSKANTLDYVLPAHPGDGTTDCRVNCKCEWRIVVTNVEKKEAAAYWELGNAEHCDTCVTRSKEWSPLYVEAIGA